MLLKPRGLSVPHTWAGRVPAPPWKDLGLSSPLGDQKGTGLSPGGWRGPRSSDMGHGPPSTDSWSV